MRIRVLERWPGRVGGPAAPQDWTRVLVERHARLAGGRQAGAGDRAGAAARGAAVVGLADATAQRQLTPVVGVQRLLDLVGPEHRRDGADLVDPLALVDRAGLGPGAQALLLQQPDGVLAQPAAVE